MKVKHKKRLVCLPDEAVEIARALGGGNISEGIRTALRLSAHATDAAWLKHRAAVIKGDALDITWTVEDVEKIRPDLTEEERRAVLQRVDRDQDSTHGVNFGSIETAAAQLFPNDYTEGAE